MNAKLALLLILSTLAVFIVAQNVVAVEINFLFWSVSISSALLIVFTLLLGLLVGWYLTNACATGNTKADRSIRALNSEGISPQGVRALQIGS